MQRFFVTPEQIDESSHRIHVTGGDVNHMKNVLRLHAGEEIWVSDGVSREYHCRIDSYGSGEALLHILYSQEPEYELPSAIWLFQGLPKSDKMDFVIQKAVELGVARIVPVRMNRCVVRLEGEKAEKKTLRWQQVSESAAKQSRRLRIPEVSLPVDLQTALEEAAGLDVILLPYELEKDMKKTGSILSGIRPGQSVGIFIGPEGGFEEEETEQIIAAGGQPITLGRRILRTETAGMALLSALMFHLEFYDKSNCTRLEIDYGNIL